MTNAEQARDARHAIADILVDHGVVWTGYIDAQIDILLRAALRASEARALAQAAGLCDARAWRWHQDSSAHRELLACADAIRGLSEPPD